MYAVFERIGDSPDALVEMTILQEKKILILAIAMLVFFAGSQYAKYNKRRRTYGKPEPEMWFSHRPTAFLILLISPLFSSSQATSLLWGEVVFLLDKLHAKYFFKKF